MVSGTQVTHADSPSLPPSLPPSLLALEIHLFPGRSRPPSCTRTAKTPPAAGRERAGGREGAAAARMTGGTAATPTRQAITRSTPSLPSTTPITTSTTKVPPSLPPSLPPCNGCSPCCFFPSFPPSLPPLLPPGVQEFGVIGEEIYSRMDIEAFLMIVRGFQPAGTTEGGKKEGKGGRGEEKIAASRTSC